MNTEISSLTQIAYVVEISLIKLRLFKKQTL